LYSEYLTKESLEGLGDFKIGEQIIHTVKYADDLVLLAKEEKVLQDMIDKLIEIGRSYGMEMNVEKTKVIRTSFYKSSNILSCECNPGSTEQKPQGWRHLL
jgi:hypothetical protein